MSIQLAVFDIAGTTVKDDDAVAHAFRNAFVKNGYAISLEAAHPYMGVKKVVAVRTMLGELNADFTDDDVSNIHSDFVTAMIDYYQHDPAVEPFADTEYVFEILKSKGVRIALNTGFPKVIADTIVNRFQWKERGLIDDYIASDEVNNGRPSPEMIQQLMNRLNVSSPEAVIKIGDTTVDIQEGKNAGCQFVVGVTTGAGKEDELLAESPTHIIHQLSDVLKLI